MLDYKVILHVDRATEYTAPATGPSWKSFESATSGIPDDLVEDEWPVKHHFF